MGPQEGVVMGTSSKSDSDSASSSIAAVQQAWLEAIKAADVERLATLVTDDVVVVHGTGRCVRGRDELKMDFRNAFKAFSVEQSASTAGLVVRGSWALEIADIETKLTPRHRRGTNGLSLNDGHRTRTSVRRVMEGRSCSWGARFIAAGGNGPSGKGDERRVPYRGCWQSIHCP